MPVHGLWELLRGAGLVEHVIGAGGAREILADKKVAVDLSTWIVEADTRHRQLQSTGGRAWPSFYLIVCFWRALHFMRMGCSVVGISDGPSAPSLKRRQRHSQGGFTQRSEAVRMLLSALGCPTYTASGEAEGMCARLSKAGAVDAIASVDSDVFPFGASGIVLKDASLASADSAWSLDVVHVKRVYEHFDLGQQGMICLANFAGCDFTRGAAGIGPERGLRCVHGLRQHCGSHGEAGLRQTMLRFLSGSVPADFTILANLTGCQTCRHCGHGSAKGMHGAKGCTACGTSTGCLPRQQACPCIFHQRRDEVALARALARAEMLPTAQRVDATWSVYEGAEVELVGIDANSWERPDVSRVVELLGEFCRYPADRVLRSLVPVLLLWDLQHPGHPSACFAPTSVLGVTSAGLAAEEHEPQHQSLLVLEWSIRGGSDPDGGLLEALNAISRPRRAVPRRMLLKWRPDLLVDHLYEELKRRAHASDLPRRCKNIQHWAAEADRLCKSWGVVAVPWRTEALFDSLSAEWRREAVAVCSAQCIASTRDPWGKAQKIIQSFGLPFDAQMREDIGWVIAPRQQTLRALLQRASTQATDPSEERSELVRSAAAASVERREHALMSVGNKRHKSVDPQRMQSSEAARPSASSSNRVRV